MEYKDFLQVCENLKAFMQEQKKLDDVLKVIAPSGTSVCEFGNKFIDNYISIVEAALKDDTSFFSWFVFENKFGKENIGVIINGNEYPVTDEKTFFDMLTNVTGDKLSDALAKTKMNVYEQNLKDFKEMIKTRRDEINVILRVLYYRQPDKESWTLAEIRKTMEAEINFAESVSAPNKPGYEFANND